MKTRIITFALIVSSLMTNAFNDSIKKRTALISKIIELAETKISNPAFLETDAWHNFETVLNSDEFKVMKDKDFYKAFNKASEALPFTHFYLRSNRPAQTSSKNIKTKAVLDPFTFKNIDSKTGLITISRFASNATQMVKVVEEASAKNYENLIIDLRGNRGGTLDAAVILGRFLTSDHIDAGVYINRSWFETENRYPTSDDIKTFPFLMDMSYKGFMTISKEKAFRMVLPPHTKPTFKGNIYILTDNYTASTCEPLVYILKRKKNVKIIGETTAGAMMSGQSFKLNNEVSIFIPVTDYMTFDGIRLDKLGIEPHIKTESDQALKRALSIIN